MAQRDRLNFRCTAVLKKRLSEAAARSHVSVSEQARISLEKLYGVEEENPVWLPEILRQAEAGTGGNPRKKHPVS